MNSWIKIDGTYQNNAEALLGLILSGLFTHQNFKKYF